MANWLRITLTIATAISFIPQLNQLWSTKDSVGIAIYYVLFNAIVATSSLAVFAACINNWPDGGGPFLHKPIDNGDRLNLLQLLVAFLFAFAFFVLTLIYYPCGNQSPKRAAIIGYTSLFCLTLLPQLSFFIDGTRKMSYGDYLVEIALIPVWLGHMLATILGVLAVVLQARQVLMQLHHKQQQQLISNPVPASALSPLSLKLQAIVFAVLAISWPWRLHRVL
ncbi:hypothetical protein ASPCAL12323 [Aspergillus calidoustus]|uniref:Uncharacterized protein n=1 Tax=Aspergillus calidoustus TaxID=454130 RepID=A0A0U5GGX8_ASPCI|nr:hypothetical protein ASPCAL12323 [Aspergillus calidoustus]